MLIPTPTNILVNLLNHAGTYTISDTGVYVFVERIITPNKLTSIRDRQP